MHPARFRGLPALTFILFVEAVQATTVGTGPGYDFPTITSALRNAQYGETIFVAEGVYDSTRGEAFPLLMKSGVDLVRLEPDMLPTIRGTGNDSVLVFDQVNDASLSGFRITGGGGVLGGGIRCALSSPNIEDCFIEDNAVAFVSETSPSGHGAAIYCHQSAPRVRRCGIRRNAGEPFWGQALHCTQLSLPEFQSCVIEHNPTGVLFAENFSFVKFHNCLIAENGGDDPFRGTLFFQSNSRLELIHCTLAGNIGGGLDGYSTLASTVRNCILWNLGQEVGPQIPVNIDHSCLREGPSGVGNIQIWPRFRNPNEGDWRLADGSPCINRGTSEGLPAGLTTDVGGSPRIAGGAIDMGAYESPAEYVPGDPNEKPERLHVRSGAKGIADGSSWEYAFPNLSEALFQAVAGMDIWIASGTYPESVFLVGGADLLGGFAGHETAAEERDHAANPTIINATGLGKSVAYLEAAAPVRIEDVTFTGGRYSSGGGIRVGAGHLNLLRCGVADNVVENYGGAVALLFDSSLDATQTLFLRNRSTGVYYGGNRYSNGNAGAIYAFVNADIRLRGCRFADNISRAEGSAIIMRSLSSLELEDCVFERNRVIGTAVAAGVVGVRECFPIVLKGCIFADNSVGDSQFLWNYAVHHESSDPIEVRDCRFMGNTNTGGLYTESRDTLLENTSFERTTLTAVRLAGGVIDRCDFIENGPAILMGGTPTNPSAAQIRNCRLLSNRGNDSQAAGINSTYQNLAVDNTLMVGNFIPPTAPPFEVTAAGVLSANSSDITLRNCVLCGNSSAGRTSGIKLSGSTLQLANCTIADNTHNNDFSASFFRVGSSSGFHVRNSILWEKGNLFPLGVSPPFVDSVNNNISDPTLAGASGNISEDPLFVMPWNGESGDWHLQCGSPSIDSGTTTEAPNHDLDGNPRPVGAGVDMGAYENCLLDLNQDRMETPRDLVLFPPEWYRGIDSSNQVLDMTSDEEFPPRIDGKDLLELIEGWR